MDIFPKAFIRNSIADTPLILQRGESIYHHGSYFLSREDPDGCFVYEVDGNYGNYTTRVAINGGRCSPRVTAPTPGMGASMLWLPFSTQGI